MRRIIIEEEQRKPYRIWTEEAEKSIAPSSAAKIDYWEATIQHIEEILPDNRYWTESKGESIERREYRKSV